MSEQSEREAYLANEGDLLRGLLEAAETKETATIEVARKGRVLFAFRIRPLSEADYNECREKATKYQRSRQFGGIRVPEEMDTSRYRSLLIYTATVDEDRQALWDSKEAQKRLNVINGADLIDKVLLAGEKDAIIAKIDEISGFGTDLESVAKN